MSDIFDERRRGLEEEYFRRRDKETLERLREAIREQARERGDQGPVTMDCPRCTGKLHAETYDEVGIDRCDTCGGVWLDAGELEQIIAEESGSSRWFHVLWPGRTRE